MRHFDHVLKVYADQGLRSAREWKTIGREVAEGTAPRIAAECRGETVSLYTRDQTQAQAPSQRRARARTEATSPAAGR